LLKRVFLSNTASLATPGIPPHVPRFRAQMAARDVNVGFTPEGRDVIAIGADGVGALAVL
jgi:hypothetical protein